MPKLNYTAKGISPDFDGYHSINVTWAELIWAGITVGRKIWEDVIQHGYHSYFEIIYRFAILKANLGSSPQGEFIKTDAYKGLDPSEKSAISYFLGLSFAKLMAHRLLSVPWLVHLDRIPDQHKKIKGNNRKRPDLVGRILRRKWCVFEAKGRSGSIPKELIQKAMEQAQMLEEIYGMTPRIQGISLSYFSSDKLRLYLEVLNECNSEAEDFEIPSGEDQFLKTYYQPFVSLIENSIERIRETNVVKVRGQEIIFVNLKEVDLDVGLDSQVLKILSSDSLEEKALMRIVHLWPQDTGERILAHPDNNDTTFLGEDGVFVRLGSSWK